MSSNETVNSRISKDPFSTSSTVISGFSPVTAKLAGMVHSELVSAQVERFSNLRT